MKNLIIAKRYSRALFKLAEEAQAIEQTGKELHDFGEILKQFPDLGNALRNPLYPDAAKKKLLITGENLNFFDTFLNRAFFVASG